MCLVGIELSDRRSDEDRTGIVARGANNAAAFWSTRAKSLANTLRLTTSHYSSNTLSGDKAQHADDDMLDTVLRRTAWTEIARNEAQPSAAVGISAVARTLTGLGASFQTLTNLFQGLERELENLHWSGQEDVILGGGRGNAALSSAREAAEECKALALSLCQHHIVLASPLSLSVWVELPDPTAACDALEEAALALDANMVLESELTALHLAAFRRAEAGRAASELLLAPLGDLSFEPTATCWKNHDTQEENTKIALTSWSTARTAATELKRRQRRFLWASLDGAPLALDYLFHAFDTLSNTVARLHEDLVCLDGVEETNHPGGSMACLPALLLATASMQQRTLEFKCKVMSSLDEVVDGGDKAKSSWLKKSAEIVEFVEEAIALGDALRVRIEDYSRRRSLAVSALKTFIETTACAMLPKNACGQPAVVTTTRCRM
jgi:hypothetical protein